MSAASPVKDALSVTREQLLPLLDQLDGVLEGDDAPGQRSFFAHIRDLLRRAQEPDDLAGPFMELSTSAFRGFQYSLEASAVIDAVLEIAQQVSHALSADGEPHH